MDTNISNLTYNALPGNFEKARRLRKNQTEAEERLWKLLRKRRAMGVKFRRQHPIFIFIADFYCHEIKMVIEVDGEVHNDPYVKERDKNRTFELEKRGIKVIRFKNEEIITDVNCVMVKISNEVKNRIAEVLSLSPSP